MRSARHRRPRANRADYRRGVRHGSREGRFIPRRAGGVVVPAGEGGAEGRGGGFGGRAGGVDGEVWGAGAVECGVGELWDVGGHV